MKSHMKNNGAGFTLLEFIIALVVAAIMASMLYTYFGSALTQSSLPVLRFQKALNLDQVMENIIADYNNLRSGWQESTAYRPNSVIIPTVSNSNGHYYKCTTEETGTSGSTEPEWPTAPDETVTDGGVKWTISGNVWKADQLYKRDEIIVPIVNNGHYYQCTGKGTSGSTEPEWPTAPGVTVTDGAVTWIGTILDGNDPTVLCRLKGCLEANPDRYDPDNFGYTVVPDPGTRFIKFIDGVESKVESEVGSDDELEFLKVTIQNNNDTNETLTQIFTIR